MGGIDSGDVGGVTGQGQCLQRFFSALAAQNRRRGHRSLVHVAGPPDWAHQVARTACGEAGGRIIWLGDVVPGSMAARPMSAAVEHLGLEAEVVIFDAYAGFDPDAFGAVAGSLLGGGLLLLLTPPAAEWADFPDPQRQRIAIEGVAPDTVPNRYLRRLVRLLGQEPDVLSLSPELMPTLPSVRPGRSGWVMGGTAEQLAAVGAIRRVATGRARRPLVITADRGRGKSAAMGLALAQLHRERRQRVLTTAPRRQALESLFRHAGDAVRTLQYRTPVDIVDQEPAADLVLVDEAAGIALELLERIVARYPRVVFASTVHGYEGTGRGFALRFRHLLDHHAPGWVGLELEEPIRWAQDDALEPLVNRLLMMDASPATPVAEQHT